MNDFILQGRSFDRLLKVSRTIADLDGSLYIENEHISEAMMYPAHSISCVEDRSS